MHLVAWLLAEGRHGGDRVGLTPDAAVRALVAADGLAVTVDEVAELDGISKAANMSGAPAMRIGTRTHG
ncbi:hypothetical protein I1A62_45355 [Rhodococcus sp. USK10]|uniref:hypothetical protein n=1 Tax=Rhodococcus TaxID=1827 RepID=UPI001C43C468|nr:MULTISPECIES: hypothetical protein [Rhodococcus]MBV6757367.1 hypothetical protein [Rhodococcus opacus]QYB04232.1 hypothetical protein I1A62_45355 [Rhodococcus sp. USK10]